MNRLEQQKPFFKALADQPSQVTRRKVLDMISEVVLNLMKRNLPVDPSLMTRLRQHKQVLRELRQRKHSVKKRRDCLMEAKGNKLFRDLYELVCVCLNRS